MRRANVILAALFTSSICFESALTVTTFSRLFPRQDACDQLFCLDSYWSTLGTSAQQTFDAFGAYLRGIFFQTKLLIPKLLRQFQQDKASASLALVRTAFSKTTQS